MWQCRLRGKIDSGGCVSAFLEERLNMGLNFILSAEVKLLDIHSLYEIDILLNLVPYG